MTTTATWIGRLIAAATAIGGLALSTAGPVAAQRELFFEETASAFWTVPHASSGPLEIAVNTAGSKRKQRTATATARVVFDGVTLVEGSANHPTRPAPFIRVDTEK